MGSYPELPLTETDPSHPRRWPRAIFAAAAILFVGAGLALALADAEGNGQMVQSPASVGTETPALEPKDPEPEPQGASREEFDLPWDGWEVEPIALPTRGPLDDEGRYLYLDVDGGSMVLSVLPEIEIRSPQIDARIDGFPVTTTRIPESTAVLHTVAIGRGTLRLQTVDVEDRRSVEVLTTVARSLGEGMDGDLDLPADVTVVSERTGPNTSSGGEAWSAKAPTGAVLQIGRVRIESPAHRRELAIVTRMMGARVVADGEVVVWFLPRMDDPSVGTISWEDGDSRWSVTGVTPANDIIAEFVQAAPHIVTQP